MEDLYRLGRTTVSCEGYHRAGDPLVLQGSCGVEYTLHLTEKGKDRYLRRPARVVHQNQEKSAPTSFGVEFIPVVMAFLGVGALIFFIAFCVSAAMNYSPPPPPPIRVRQERPERGEFFEGYMMGSAVARNPSPVRERHHHTSTTIINNNNNNNNVASQRPVVVEVKKKVRRSPKKSKSTGYGGSVSRGQDYDTWSTTTARSYSYSTSNDDDDDKDESSSSSTSTSTSTYTSTGYGGSSSR